MAETTTRIFQSTKQKTALWLKDLVEIGGLKDEAQAYSALRAVLQVLRDRLTTDEVAQLGAQLPMLVRGFYYGGWKPWAAPVRTRNKEEFFAAVREQLRGGGDFDVEDATKAVLQLVGRKVSDGEVDDIKRILPEPLRELFE